MCLACLLILEYFGMLSIPPMILKLQHQGPMSALVSVHPSRTYFQNEISQPVSHCPVSYGALTIHTTYFSAVSPSLFPCLNSHNITWRICTFNSFISLTSNLLFYWAVKAVTVLINWGTLAVTVVINCGTLAVTVVINWRTLAYSKQTKYILGIMSHWCH